MKKRVMAIVLASVLTVSTLGMAVSAASVTASADAVSAAAVGEVSLDVVSTLYGSAYTNGKSTLKDHLNTTVSYGEGSAAVFTLSASDGSAIDDSLIDSSNAVVTLTDGDGYYADEYTFLATALDGVWVNGQYVYTLEDGDLEINKDVYPQTVDPDSGREWSCLGGDGHGNYHFNLTVSGIVYNGTEVESQTFGLDISIFGYDYTSDAASLYTEDGTSAVEPVFASLNEKLTAPVFTWVGDGELPILCDSLEDDFYITWPSGSDASSITASDVTITLSSAYGDTLVLSANEDYYVQSSASETQIAVTWQNWDFIPVYSVMTIEVNGAVSASAVYDIASVYVYEAQQGGGGTNVDGTVTAYSFYGLANLESWEQILSAPVYYLKYVVDDVTYYYGEDAEGNGFLTLNQDEAYAYDATAERNPQVIGNTAYITRRDAQEIEKVVDGITIVFTQSYSGGSLLSPSTCDQSLEAEPGYVIPWGTSNWITNEKGAWQTGVETGWTTIEVTPYQGKFEWSVARGSSQQFTAGTEVVSWEIYGDVDEGTTVSQDGVVTVAADESHSSFAVTVRDAAGNYGTVTVKVTDPDE